MQQLDGRRILITGANRGIGKALVEASVTAGATVFARTLGAATALMIWSSDLA